MSKKRYAPAQQHLNKSCNPMISVIALCIEEWAGKDLATVSVN